MVILADNDVIFKLAAYDLLESFPAVLEVDRSAIHVLDSIPFYPRKNPNIEKHYGEAAIERTLDFVDDLPKIGLEDIPSDVYDQLLSYESIDVGEALLFAAAIQYDMSRLVTGDKRCIKALHRSAFDDIIGAINGCVVCLEQLFLWYITRLDFTIVCDCVMSTPGIDRVLNDIAFRRGSPTSEESARSALRSYRDRLQNKTGALLVDA